VGQSSSPPLLARTLLPMSHRRDALLFLSSVAVYALVSRGVTVLAEQTDAGVQGNFANITRVLLKKIAPEDGKMSYAYDQYVFHYVVSGGLTCLCMTEKECSRVQAFRFLADVEADFLRMFGARWAKANAYAFEGDFKAVLTRLMAKHAAPLRDDKIGQINDQLKEVKTVMSRNIEMVLERGEKIEILVTKTEQMEAHAFRFNKKATTLRRKFCCANYKWGFVLLIVLLGIIYMILAFSCGGPKIPKCRK